MVTTSTPASVETEGTSRRWAATAGAAVLVLVVACMLAVAPSQATADAHYTSAHDAFSRSTSHGWGNASVGGAYAYPDGSSHMSVRHGKAHMALAGGERREATLTQFSDAAVRAAVSVRVRDQAATSAGTRVALLARVRGTSFYRLLARITPAGTVYAAIDRVDGRHGYVRIGHRRVVATGVAPGAVLRLRLRAVGSAKVHLTGKVAVAGRSRRLSATDSSASRIRSGSVGVWADQPDGGRHVTRVVWDRLVASRPKARSSASTPTPPASTTPSQPSQSSASAPAAVRGKPYVWTSSVAWGAYRSQTNLTAKRIDYNIAATPAGIWVFGTSSGVSTVSRLVAAASAKSQVPQFVLYAIPNRDCGGLSSGGVSSDSAYRSWIDQVAAAIGSHPAIVILEPDAISFCNNDPAVRAERTALLTYAAKRLHDVAPNVATYLHAGSGQLSWSYVVPALVDSGMKYMRGFALNVSSHGSTATEESYGDQLVAKLAAAGVSGKHYVVDTSRNGVVPQANPGAPYNSCNNESAALGSRPTTKTAGTYDDAYLWIKSPGLSDGTCHAGDPSAGSWFPELATNLVTNARDHGTIDYWPLP